MKGYILLVLLFLVGVGIVYQMMDVSIPDSEDESLSHAETVPEKKHPLPLDNEPVKTQRLLAQQPNPSNEVHVYNGNNAAEMEQLAASMRANGIPEEDIQQLMDGVKEEPSANVGVGEEAKVYDTGNPTEMEELVAVMRASGVSEEDIQELLDGVKQVPSSQALGEGEAEIFDPSDNSDMQKMIASMGAQGIPEEDIRQLLDSVHNDQNAPVPPEPHP